MELEILKFICANQGAVNTDELLFNLDSTIVSEIIFRRERFVLCQLNGQPRVLARTNLRLCRVKGCAGTCRALHLCKNILFSGSCRYTRGRRVCVFPHDLDSDYNQGILREHELQGLSRAELCTLLLQSDNTLLPPICFDYNNGQGEFGRCQEGNSCKRMHICESYLNGDCSCFRTHDFNAPQPLKSLNDKGVPEELFHSLKTVYKNKEALRLHNRGKGQQHSSNRDNGSVQGDRGRGRGGHRGNRGKRGNQTNLKPNQRAISSSDILADIASLNIYTADGLDEDNIKQSVFTSDTCAAANDTDASSEDGQSKNQISKPNKSSASVRGRGGNKGNHLPPQNACSTNDLCSVVSDKDSNNRNDQNKRQWPKPVKDKTEICMYFIKGHCKHEDKCFKAHDKMPYRWEIKKGDEWKALPNNEVIEKDYCDPKKTYSSSSPPVHFDTMTCETNQVRRLSTVNSLVEPTFIHTTEWLWYWEDEFGRWTLYSSAAVGNRAADIDSAFLEQKFLDNGKDVVEFTAGSQSYTLSFQDMIQTNKQYGTKRLVKRRPLFVSAADVQEKRVRRPPRPTLGPLPDHWDKTQIPAVGYKLISLQRTSDEFKEVEALFCNTMFGSNIIKIERIQNKSLWEVFQWQKNQMKNNNNGRIVTEKKLFHGTSSKYVDAICTSNFDWRICGTHGTAFGKGSYFARDSKYSHSYTDASDVKSMFVSRVLVGDFTKGSSDYCRPPSKDGGDVNFFDSCVDNITNPSIFVVFEKHQIYPEYLLQYKTLNPVPAKRTAPQPSISVHQPSTVSHKPSTSAYQSSLSSNQSSASSHRSSTASNQSSASSHWSSTASNQSSASSHWSSTASNQSSASSYQATPYLYHSSTSSYSSGTSSINPRTFTMSYQPSSGSYQYQPRQSSPTPPPTPKAKKQSDSCVIA